MRPASRVLALSIVVLPPGCRTTAASSRCGTNTGRSFFRSNPPRS